MSKGGGNLANAIALASLAAKSYGSYRSGQKFGKAVYRVGKKVAKSFSRKRKRKGVPAWSPGNIAVSSYAKPCVPNKRRRRRKRKRTLKSKVRKIASKTAKISKAANASIGHLTYRYLNSRRYGQDAIPGSKIVFMLNGFTADHIIAALTRTRIYDSTSNTFVVQDSSTVQPNVAQSFYVPTMSFSAQLRNNYKTDIKLQIYCCAPKVDTDLEPYDLWVNGINDHVQWNPAVGPMDPTAYGTYPTDSVALTRLWFVQQVYNKNLSPGQTAQIFGTKKNITYKPIVQQQEPEIYKPSLKSFKYLVVVSGTPCHDSTGVTLVGQSGMGIDLTYKRTVDLKYDAGGKVRYYDINDAMFAKKPTIAGVQSHQPTVTNINYGV